MKPEPWAALRNVPGWLAGLALAAAGLAGGCSLKQAAPSKQTFLLEARRPASSQPSAKAPVLRVRSLQVAAPYDGRAFIYRRGEWNYESDFYHEFLVPPRAALTEQVRQWLQGSGLFSSVLDPASKAEAAVSLEGAVSALYGDFREKDKPKAVLAIQFVVTDEASASAMVVFQHGYRQELPLAGGSADALAAAWSKGLELILAACEQDLAAFLRSGQKPPRP